MTDKLLAGRCGAVHDALCLLLDGPARHDAAQMARGLDDPWTTALALAGWVDALDVSQDLPVMADYVREAGPDGYDAMTGEAVAMALAARSLLDIHITRAAQIRAARASRPPAPPPPPPHPQKRRRFAIVPRQAS
jgi:hypothetical protein